jgi:tryptophan-rich sensory protein
MNKYLLLFLCIIATLLIGAVGGFASASSIDTWYITLVKPSFNPPNYLFGPVWSLLYILMGISLYLIIRAPKSLEKSLAFRVFIIQYVLNFCWSFLFFKFHLLGIALIEILLMWLSIVWMIIVFKPVNKIAAFIQIPYLCWVSFASILNASIWYLNK